MRGRTWSPRLSDPAEGFEGTWRVFESLVQPDFETVSAPGQIPLSWRWRRRSLSADLLRHGRIRSVTG